MDFFEHPIFPEDISFDATMGPSFRTDLAATDGGWESINVAWSQARITMEVSHLVKRPAKWQPLLRFFRIAGGRARAFRVKDWTDWQCPDGLGVGVFVQLTSTTFQMSKLYELGSLAEIRFIRKPISPVQITGGVVTNIDYTTGVVTVSSGTPTAWTGNFHVPMRFDVDEMKPLVKNKAGTELLIDWASIPLVEVRV